MAQGRTGQIRTGRSANGGNSGPLHGVLGPVLWIVALIACYCLIANWQAIPSLLTSASAMVL